MFSIIGQEPQIAPNGGAIHSVLERLSTEISWSGLDGKLAPLPFVHECVCEWVNVMVK